MTQTTIIGGISDTETPGTVYLVDISHTEHETQHAGDKDILLVPQPLPTRRDPLVHEPTKTRLSRETKNGLTKNALDLA